MQTAQLSRTCLRPRGPPSPFAVRSPPPAPRPRPNSSLLPQSSLACFEITPPAGSLLCCTQARGHPTPGGSEVKGQLCLPRNPHLPTLGTASSRSGFGTRKDRSGVQRGLCFLLAHVTVWPRAPRLSPRRQAGTQKAVPACRSEGRGRVLVQLVSAMQTTAAVTGFRVRRRRQCVWLGSKERYHGDFVELKL